MIEKREKKVQLGKKGWDNFKQVSEEWSCLKIPETERFHNYPRVYKLVRDVEEPVGTVHKTCRTNFELKKNHCLGQFDFDSGECSSSQNDGDADDDADISCISADAVTIHSKSPVKSRLRSTSTVDTQTCFICNEVTEIDHLPYKVDGLGRCEAASSAKRLKVKKDIYLEDKSHRYYEASKRLDLQLKVAHPLQINFLQI